MTISQHSDASEKSIGDIISAANKLTPEQMDKVLAYQRETGFRFGEAAIALGFVKREDVLWALSQQFSYHYHSGDAASPMSPELVVATNPFDTAAEFFRDVRSQLLSTVLSDDAPRCALAVCSPDVGDGKTFFAANLAIAFSQLGQRTLLIDADLRSPRLQNVFSLDRASHEGLSSILSGRTEANVIMPIASLPSLYLLPAGIVPPNPLELVQKSVFDLLIMELLKKFNYVIVDTPAAAHGSDARVIASKCGASVVVSRKNVTKTSALKQLVDLASKPPHRFAGVILNERGQ